MKGRRNDQRKSRAAVKVLLLRYGGGVSLSTLRSRSGAYIHPESSSLKRRLTRSQSFRTRPTLWHMGQTAFSSKRQRSSSTRVWILFA